MAELTNLTDRISHLRDKTDSSIVVRGNKPAHQKNSDPQKSQPMSRSTERPFATDLFMLFAYALLSVALTCQFILITIFDLF